MDDCGTENYTEATATAHADERGSCGLRGFLGSGAVLKSEPIALALWHHGEMNVQIRVAEDEIRDLQRIIDADKALLEMQKSPERRTALLREMGSLEYKIDRLREHIKDLPAGL